MNSFLLLGWCYIIYKIRRLLLNRLVRVVSRATTDVKGDDRHDRDEKTDVGVWKTLWFVEKSVTEFGEVGEVGDVGLGVTELRIVTTESTVRHYVRPHQGVRKLRTRISATVMVGNTMPSIALDVFSSKLRNLAYNMAWFLRTHRVKKWRIGCFVLRGALGFEGKCVDYPRQNGVFVL